MTTGIDFRRQMNFEFQFPLKLLWDQGNDTKIKTVESEKKIQHNS